MRSSQQGPLPYLSFCGVEVANAARTVAYLRSGLGDTGQGRWELGAGNLCSVLYRLGGGSSHGTYISPAIDPAPWYDATEPGSRSFLGAIMLGLTGYDSTLTRTSTRRIVGLGGGTFGGQQRTVREWKFRAALVNGDDYGAEFGLRWLTAVLQSSACVGCETCHLTVRLVCPPDDGSNDSLGAWTSYEVALVDGPKEVTQYSSMPADDVLAGCRDYTIVEWTMEAGNPMLYRSRQPSASASAVYTGGCAVIGDIAASASAITDAVRAADVGGDGLLADSSFGIWDQTNNFFPNGGGEVAVTSTDWNPTAGAAAARSLTQHKFGQACVEVTTDGSGANQGVSARTATGFGSVAGSQWTLSVWLRGKVGGEQVTLRPSVTNTDTTVTSGTVLDVVLTTDWQRFTTHVTVAIGKTGDRLALLLGVRVGATATLDFYADGLQIEPGAVATPYVEAFGTPGTFRSQAIVSGPAFGTVLDPAKGWIAFRTRMGWTSTTARDATPTLWRWQHSLTVYMELHYNVALARWELVASNGAGTDTVFVADTFAAGDLRTIVATWDNNAGTLKLSLNGAPFASVAYAHPPLTMVENICFIGHGASSTHFFDGDVKWYAASSYAALGDAQAALVAGYAPFDPAPADLIGVPTGMNAETMTWPADTTAIDTYAPHNICDFLFGPPRPLLCEAFTLPARGAIGAVFTLTSVGGFGTVVLQAWPDCNNKSGAAPLQLEISNVPAGATVVVDSATHTVTVTQAGVTTDGSSLLQLPADRPLQWIEANYCDALGCFCAAVAACASGDLTVTLETQTREG